MYNQISIFWQKVDGKLRGKNFNLDFDVQNLIT